MNSKILEIGGAGVHNKGALLMLQTVLHRFAEGLSPEVRFAVDTRSTGDFYQRAREGLYQITPFWFGQVDIKHRVGSAVFNILDHFLPDRFRRDYGLVRRAHCQGFIDISGLAFCDLFPAYYASDAAALIRRFYYGRTPVVYMPQMAGPFTEVHAEAFRRLYPLVDRFYVRDRISYNYVRDVIDDPTRLLQAPDITIFAGHDVDPTPPADRTTACIVPNARMLDTAKENWAEAYRTKLLNAAKRFSQAGLNVRLLIHDTAGDDLRFARTLLKEPGMENVELFCEENTTTVRRALSQARCVVGSRYHSLVAALSSGVPAIALGWAHKYETLLEDFGIGQLCLRADCNQGEYDAALDSLIDGDKLQGMHEALLSAKEAMRPVNEAMWNDVLGLWR
jgi:polysaccharide pyruvyl transferase WcaK-like protein